MFCNPLPFFLTFYKVVENASMPITALSDTTTNVSAQRKRKNLATPALVSVENIVLKITPGLSSSPPIYTC
jgi:hypothetical protein